MPDELVSGRHPRGAPANAGALVSMRRHGTQPAAVLRQLLRSCAHAAPVHGHGRHAHLTSAELCRMSTLYAPSYLAHMKPPEKLSHHIHNHNSVLTWSCAKWSHSLYWTTTVLSPRWRDAQTSSKLSTNGPSGCQQCYGDVSTYLSCAPM